MCSVEIRTLIVRRHAELVISFSGVRWCDLVSRVYICTLFTHRQDYTYTTMARLALLR